MKIASAQINSTVGEISRNLEEHYQMIDLASQHDVDLIIFPEMSLTGYCREEAADLIMTEHSKELDLLKQKSIQENIIIVVGAPVSLENKIYIGSFILQPNGQVKIYTKQFLHEGEDLFYQSSFEHNPQLVVQNEKLSFAICADIENELHPQNAFELKSSLYLPSIFYSKNGIKGGLEKLVNYAETYSLTILMSNFSGELWNVEAGGQSCFINNKGELKDKLPTDGRGLIVIEKNGDEWRSEPLLVQ
ncbi:carbon-nitrogen hydrolase family protein [Flammeovirga sp. OC4]|uniref:carbon-nitrogen hydrolase family protein n=1 Tax=Flammeovirga sp. OC4 TaxID=1382345 RepID=UPI0005C51BD5|nr:carbon-nitrogen hydrolase family protein [Flammeovirga sp. OC4]